MGGYSGNQLRINELVDTSTHGDDPGQHGQAMLESCFNQLNARTMTAALTSNDGEEQR